MFTCVHVRITLFAAERGVLLQTLSRMLKKHYGKKKQTSIIIVVSIANRSWGETVNGYTPHVAIVRQ